MACKFSWDTLCAYVLATKKVEVGALSEVILKKFVQGNMILAHEGSNQVGNHFMSLIY